MHSPYGKTSRIKAYEYKDGKLYIEYPDGAKWSYEIPSLMYDCFEAADRNPMMSLGKFLKQIKEYPSEKL